MHVYIMVHAAWNSSSDGTLNIEAEPRDREESFENPFFFRDNRSGVELGSSVDSSLLTCAVKHSSSSASSVPTVQWIRNGEVVLDDSNHDIISTSGLEFQSSLEITNFALSDAGVYQCIFIDSDTDAEVITTTPFRLDTGIYQRCRTLHIYMLSCILLYTQIFLLNIYIILMYK